MKSRPIHSVLPFALALLVGCSGSQKTDDGEVGVSTAKPHDPTIVDDETSRDDERANADEQDSAEDEPSANVVDEVAVGALVADGLHYVKSRKSFDDTWSDLIGALESNETITITKKFDQKADAVANKRDLGPTRMVVFGNPALGTPLMQENRTVGIDLPRKVLLFGGKKGVLLAWDSPEYLAARHDVADVGTLATMGDALDKLGGDVGSDVVSVTALTGIRKREGLQVTKSDYSFDETYARLKEAIEKNPSLRVAFEVDHAANAKKVGLDLLPTKLIALGFPTAELDMMKSERTAAIDLPHKILVWYERDGDVKVAYTEPSYIVRRHRLNVDEQNVKDQADLLHALVEAASDDD